MQSVIWKMKPLEIDRLDWKEKFGRKRREEREESLLNKRNEENVVKTTFYIRPAKIRTGFQHQTRYIRPAKMQNGQE